MEKAEKGTVPAVMRAARLLDVLSAAERPLTLAALTAELGLPKSSVHGLCKSLVETGLVMRFADNTYHLGVRVVDLAHSFLARTDLTTEFIRILEEMNPLPEESIVLSVLDGADVVYVACRKGTRAFGFDFRFGMRLPANCASSGKALLSTLPVETIQQFGERGGLKALTEKSITDPRLLSEELARVRSDGYAVDEEETRLGMVCFGAPVFGASAPQAIAAVGISMPKAALSPGEREKIVAVAKDVAQALSARLGSHGASR